MSGTALKTVDRPTGAGDIGAIFLCLSDSFLRPMSREKWDAFRVTLDVSARGLPSLGALADIMNGTTDEGWAEAGREYHSLFSGLRSPFPTLWESCCSEHDARLISRVTLDVAKQYGEAGVHVDEAFGQPPDHIGIECAFVAHLCRGGGKFDGLRRMFIERHFSGFAGIFSEELRKYARHPIYSALAGLAQESAALLLGSLETEPRFGASRPLPAGLRQRTEGDAFDERSVPVCGCGNCGGRCPLTATVSGGCVLKLGPAEQPGVPRERRINICARGSSYHGTFLSGQRLRYPMKRAGGRGEGRFERISWDEATDIIASEVKRAGEKYGPQSRYVNYSSGVNAAARGDLFARNLLALDGGFLGRYNSYSTACTTIATPYTYGTAETGNFAGDLLNSKLIILWGHNPAESVFGSSVMFYLKEAKKKGIEIISVDPRRGDTSVALADHWIGLRPTTDSAFMDAMAHVIFSDGLQDQKFMDRFCVGFDGDHMPSGMEDRENYRDYVFGRYDGTPKDPEWAEAITGASADTIRQLARKYATSKPAALLQGYGPQRNGNGEQTVRSGAMLACLTGNVGIPGGSACGAGYVARYPDPEIASVPNPYPGKIPAFLWTDAILRGDDMTSANDGVIGVKRLDAGVKLIFNLAGNTLVNQHSDVNRSASILRDTKLCEFIVCSDLFLTSSAKFADILLPGTSMFECENIGMPWREGDYLLYCDKSTEPLFECRSEYDWLSDVARKMGYYEKFTREGKSVRELLAAAYETVRGNEDDMPDFETFRARGVHFYKKPSRSVAFEANVGDPENNPFPTPSGKIEIFSPRLYAMGNPLEIPALPKYVPSFEGPADPLFAKYPFQLLGWHTKRRTHSVHDNNRTMDRLDPLKIWINPSDARERNIQEDDLLDVFNDRGTVRIRAHVTDRIIPGVLAISQGGWFTPDEAGVDLRGCINTLTTARPTPLAKGNPQHSNLVDIARSV